jgi:Ca-activated chloride channel family protein
MLVRLKSLWNKYRKPLIFGLYGGIGCLLMALFVGELWLHFTKLPPLTAEPPPQAIVLLIDTSGSMEGNKLVEVQSAATKFIEQQDLQNNQLAVVAFNSQAYTLSELGSSQSDLEQGISELNSDGGTNMAAGLVAALRTIQSPISQSGTKINRNILLFTDGLPHSKVATTKTAFSVKNQGVRIVAVGTGDANVRFLTRVTGKRSQVFFAGSGQIDQAFQQAAVALANAQLVERDSEGYYGLFYGSMRIGVWTGLLSLGTSLALIIGQNYYLHRPLLNLKEAGLAIGAGFFIGVCAGVTGQVLYSFSERVTTEVTVAAVNGLSLGLLVSAFLALIQRQYRSLSSFLTLSVASAVSATGLLLGIIFIGAFWSYLLIIISAFIALKTSNSQVHQIGLGLIVGAMGHFFILDTLGDTTFITIVRLMGWTILGILLGAGMSFFIPNLKLNRALLGGGLGGMIGAIFFILISGFAGSTAGRLGGAVILGFFIGLMIALADQITKAYLLVHWNSKENSQISLGNQPILIGNSREAHVRIRTDQHGKPYPPVVAQVLLDGNQVIMEYSQYMSEWGMKKFTHQVKNLDRRRFGKIEIEVRQETKASNC